MPEVRFVCPLPEPWGEAYSKLLTFWQGAGEGTIITPPRPPTVETWDDFSDEERSRRWERTIAWARSFGCGHLIPELDPDECHYVT